MSTICLRYVALMTAALVIVGCGEGNRKKSEDGGSAVVSTVTPVKIGAVLPLTGDVASWGEDSSNGINLAIEIANHSSKKYAFSVVYEDSKGSAAEAVSAARKLTSVDKVVAIIGDNVSGPTIALVPIADKAKIPVISPSASSPKLSGMSKYFFRVYPSDTVEGSYMAKVARETLGLKRVVILFVTNDFGTGLRDVFQKSFEDTGGAVVESLGYNEDETDFRPYLTKAKAANPDGVYLAGYFKDGGAILKQARELGIESRFLGSTTHEDPQLITIGQDAANGLVYPFSTGYDEQSTEEAVVTFQEAFKRKYNKPPGLVAALGYDCARVTIAAVEKAGPQSESIRKEFAATQKFPGASGEITFDANGDVHKAVHLKTVKDGKFVLWETEGPINETP